MFSTMLARFAASTVILILVGCSGDAEVVPTATLTGEVKRMTGEPYDNVMVVFYPQSGPTAMARTNDVGQFTAQVPLGEARVAVVANAEASSTDNSPEAMAAAAEEKPRIKPSYSSPETSGLTVTVQAEQTDKVVLVVE